MTALRRQGPPQGPSRLPLLPSRRRSQCTALLSRMAPFPPLKGAPSGGGYPCCPLEGKVARIGAPKGVSFASLNHCAEQGSPAAAHTICRIPAACCPMERTRGPRGFRRGSTFPRKFLFDRHPLTAYGGAPPQGGAKGGGAKKFAKEASKQSRERNRRELSSEESADLVHHLRLVLDEGMGVALQSDGRIFVS